MYRCPPDHHRDQRQWQCRSARIDLREDSFCIIRYDVVPHALFARRASLQENFVGGTVIMLSSKGATRYTQIQPVQQLLVTLYASFLLTFPSWSSPLNFIPLNKGASAFQRQREMTVLAQAFFAQALSLYSRYPTASTPSSYTD